jgi:hypothetical protein
MFGDVFIAKITANIVANGISLDNLGGKHVPGPRGWGIPCVTETPSQFPVSIQQNRL